MSKDNFINDQLDEITDFVIDADESQEDKNEFLLDEDSAFDVDSSLLGQYLSAISENSDVTLTEVAMGKADANDDEALKFAAVLGMDLGTGKKVTLEQSLQSILIDPQQESIAVNELGEEVEIEISPNFDEIELQRYHTIFSNMFVFRNSKMVSKELKAKVSKAQEIMRTHMALVKKRNEIIETGKKVGADLKYLDKIKDVLVKGSQKKKLTDEDKQILNDYEDDLMQVIPKINNLRSTAINLIQEEKKVNALIERYKEMEVTTTREITVIKGKMHNLTPTEEFKKQVEELMKMHSKIVGVEFGGDMYSTEFRERPIAVKCSCGSVTITDITRMPSYTSGNIVSYLKERTKINPNVKENYFSDKNVTKSRELRHELMSEKNALEKRIDIPGITDTEKEPLKCKSCEKFLLFPPSALDRLTERSFGHEKLAVELVASNKGKDLKTGELSITMYLSKLDVELEYLTNLGLEEYRLSKITRTPRISSDALTDDSNDKRNGQLSERALRRYRKLDYGTFNRDEVVRELTGHIKNINLALDSLLKDFRVPKAKNLKTRRKMSPTELEKLAYKAKKNQAVSNFIVSYRYLIVLYAVSKGMSSQSISYLIKSKSEEIKELKRMLFEFFVDYVIESVIEGHSLLEVERGYVGSVDLDKTNLPHANFFNCYKSLVRKYLLHGNIVKIKNDYEVKDYYKQFKTISEISLIEDSEEQVRRSEIFVKELRDKMENFFMEREPDSYVQARNRMFMSYLGNTIELENNYDELGRSQAWLYYEMRITGTELKNTQLIDADLFAELYNDKLRELSANK